MMQQKIDLETKLDVNAASAKTDVARQFTEVGILTTMQFAGVKAQHEALEQVCTEEQVKV